tara:strand:- start:1444 stop:1614 length:171 start_codon:yes stop_codon:yes gene_type:complete
MTVAECDLERLKCRYCGHTLAKVQLDGRSVVEIKCQWCRAMNRVEAEHLTNGKGGT